MEIHGDDEATAAELIRVSTKVCKRGEKIFRAGYGRPELVNVSKASQLADVPRPVSVAMQDRLSRPDADHIPDETVRPRRAESEWQRFSHGGSLPVAPNLVDDNVALWRDGQVFLCPAKTIKVHPPKPWQDRVHRFREGPRPVTQINSANEPSNDRQMLHFLHDDTPLLNSLATASAVRDEVRLLRAELTEVRPLELWSRINLHSQLRRTIRELRAFEVSLDPEAVDRLVDQVIGGIFAQLRGASTHRNPFHSEVLSDLSEWATLTHNAVLAASVRYILSSNSYPVARFPEIAARLRTDRVRDQIERTVDSYAAISAGETFLTQVQYPISGGSAFLVQHLASGLRARFILDRDDNIGRIFSKPYGIRSIAPEGTQTPEWECVVGLGIGQRIYQRGAAEFPGYRWASAMPSDYARGLRRKLHKIDPYTWQFGECSWCNGPEVIWRNAARSDFINHPE